MRIVLNNKKDSLVATVKSNTPKATKTGTPPVKNPIASKKSGAVQTTNENNSQQTTEAKVKDILQVQDEAKHHHHDHVIAEQPKTKEEEQVAKILNAAPTIAHEHAHNHKHADGGCSSSCGHDLAVKSKEAPEHTKARAQLEKFAGIFEKFALFEVITGALATAFSKSHAGWLSWTFDSLIEFMQNKIIAAKDLSFVPKPFMDFVDMISSKDHKGGTLHTHGVTPQEVDPQKEKLIGAISLVSSLFSMAYSLIKPNMAPSISKTKPSFVKRLFTEGLPLVNTLVMYSSAIIKSKVGSFIGSNCALNHRIEDVICGTESAILAASSFFTRTDKRVAKFVEILLGTGFSFVSITNGLKALGHEYLSLDFLFGGGHDDSKTKYKLTSLEKSAVADRVYDFIAKVAKLFDLGLPSLDTLKNKAALPAATN